MQNWANIPQPNMQQNVNAQQAQQNAQEAHPQGNNLMDLENPGEIFVGDEPPENPNIMQN